jgi:hypothetical protein
MDHAFVVECRHAPDTTETQRTPSQHREEFKSPGF